MGQPAVAASMAVAANGLGLFTSRSRCRRKRAQERRARYGCFTAASAAVSLLNANLEARETPADHDPRERKDNPHNHPSSTPGTAIACLQISGCDVANHTEGIASHMHNL